MFRSDSPYGFVFALCLVTLQLIFNPFIEEDGLSLICAIFWKWVLSCHVKFLQGSEYLYLSFLVHNFIVSSSRNRFVFGADFFTFTVCALSLRLWNEGF